MQRERKSLSKRYDTSYQNREGKSQSIIRPPQGIEFFSIKEEGTFRLIIIPYLIKTNNHPLVVKKGSDIKIGDLDYVFDVWVHRSIGPEQFDAVCLRLNYGKTCPVCESKEYGKPSRRVYYNVIDADHPNKGIQIFHYSHYLFEKELIEEAKVEGAQGFIRDFADYENGDVIQFRTSKASAKGNIYYECKSFKFLSRKNFIEKGELKEEWIKNAISFDDIVTIYTNEDLTEMLYPETEENIEEIDKSENRKENRKEKEECPYNHEFGEDNDNEKYIRDCDECKIWAKCEREYRRIHGKK